MERLHALPGGTWSGGGGVRGGGCICCSRRAARTAGLPLPLQGVPTASYTTDDEPPPVDPTGHRTVPLGEMLLHPMQDGTVAMPLQAVLPQAVAEVEAGGFAHHLDRLGNLPFSYGCTLAESCARHVLLDTSLGHVDPPDTSPSRDIRDLLRATAGISRHDVDAVCLSHGHPDHVAGSVLRTDDGELVPMFPNAVHYLQQAEYDFASGPMREAWKFDTYLSPVEEAGLLRIVDGPARVTAEIDLLDGFAGHTPGLQVARLRSKGQTGYYIGDALHQTIQFKRPEWSPIFDWDATLGGQSRRKLLDRVAREKALLFSPHLPFPGVGFSVPQAGPGGGFSFEPIVLPKL